MFVCDFFLRTKLEINACIFFVIMICYIIVFTMHYQTIKIDQIKINLIINQLFISLTVARSRAYGVTSYERRHRSR